MKKKILIVNFGGLGDQILFFPVLETVKQVFNDPYITFVTEPRSKSVKNLTDSIDELFISNLKTGSTVFEVFKFLKKAIFGKYDLVISSGSSKFVAVLLFLTGIKRRIGYDSGTLGRILLTDAVTLNQNQYAANMYHDLVSSFKDSAETKIPEIKITLDEEKKISIKDLISFNRSERKKIVIHPGVSRLSIEKGIIKFWPTDKWAEFIEKLLDSGEYSVILTGGPDDREIFSKLRKKIDFNRENLLDLSEKKFSIEEFACIVELSDMLVCVDSAPMHIAVGLKKSVTALFGPTDEKKLLPSGNTLFTPVKNDRINCRPCLWDKRQTSCEDLACLDIEAEHVFSVVTEKLFSKM